MGQHLHTYYSCLLRSTKMLKLVVAAAVMLHVVASKPMDVDVEVTVNGVKIPINNLPPKTGAFTLWDKSKEPKAGLMGPARWPGPPDKGNRAEQAKSGGYGTWDKSKEPKTTGLMYGWGPDKGNRAEQAKSGGYGTWRL